MVIEGTKMAYCCRRRPPLSAKLALPTIVSGLCLLAAISQWNVLVTGYPSSGSSPSTGKPADISTSSPIAAAVEAAAAAALGSIGSSSIGSVSAANDDYGLKSTASATSGSAPSHSTSSAPLTKIVSVISSGSHAQVTTSPAPQSSSITMIHKLHKHNNGSKKINVMDKLHKFDLFIDPVCERLSKLSEKQLNKVYLQLKQFSLHTNNSLARCFADHGFPFTTLSMIRHQLGTFCTARSGLNEFYRQFSACAGRVWSPLIETELDKILKERIDQGKKVSNTKEQTNAELTNAELSLIDDIVAHLHDEQVQEIASELAQEQQHSTTTTTHRPMAIVLQQQSSQSPVPVHQTIGKLTQTDIIENSHVSVATESSMIQQQQQQPQSPLSGAGKQTDITVIEVEPQAAAPVGAKVIAVESNSSLQQQLNSLAGPESVIPQMDKTTPLPQLTTITLIESPASVPQVAPTLGLPPPTTSQPLILIAEPQPQVASPTTQSPIIVAVSTEHVSAAAAAIAAAANPVPQLAAPASQVAPTQPAPLQNSIHSQPEPLAAVAAGAATKAFAGSAGTSAGHEINNPAQEVAAVHQQAVNSVVSNMIDNALSSNTFKQANPESAHPLADGVAPTTGQQQVVAVSATAVQSQPPAAAAAPLPLSPALPVVSALAASSATTNLNGPPAPDQSSKSKLMEAAVKFAVGGATEANLAKPTTVPAVGQPGASSLANMLLKSIDLVTKAPIAVTAAPFAAAVAGLPSGNQLAPAQTSTSVAVATSASSATPPLAGPPTLVPSGPLLSPPTTVNPPPAVIPAPSTGLPMDGAAGLATASAAAVVQQAPLAGALPLPESPISPTKPGGVSTASAAIATVAVPPPVPVAAVKPIEPAVLRNIDTALDMISKSSSNSPANQTIIAVPAKGDHSNKAVSVTKLEFITTSSTTAKPYLNSLKVIMVASPTTTGKPAAATAIQAIKKVQTVDSTSTGSVLVVESKQQISKKVSQATTKKPSQQPKQQAPHRNGERELLKLKGKYGKLADVHDVIVVGQHVDGDDGLSDYDDHSDHHDEHEEHGEDHEHHDHHEHEKLTLDHKVSALKSKSSKLIKVETVATTETKASKEEEDEDLRHHDHEHLMEGLQAGDVIHVDAGEPDRSSD